MLVLDYRCPKSADAHEARTGLFPDSEGYVRGTKTIVTYDLDLKSGSTALDAQHRSFSTQQSWSERFWEFFRLGAEHLLTGLDHILFLLALAAIYRLRDWRDSLWVVSAFTVGHSLTLALAVTGTLTLPTRLIEFLIPLTIVATCVENLVVRDRARALWRGRYRPVFAGVFGLVHGAGFANYLRDLFVAPIALPLFGFNLGIELGQLAILGLAAVGLTALDRGVGHRVRVVAVSAMVVALAARMAVERLPW
jgi:hydrogenase/urease accessory protein HupE